MNSYYGTIVLVTGGWLIANSFIMNTKNIQSAIIFKVIPFFLGISCLYVSSKLLGFI
jgi:hypothetical protein